MNRALETRTRGSVITRLLRAFVDNGYSLGGVGGSVATDAIFDAKGDLAAGTGADAASRLAVGTNGHVLVADSTQATGLRWGVAADPVSDDGDGLGTAALRWSDLFLAEGGVINWDNGDATITQTGDEIAVGGATLKLAAGTTSIAPLTFQSGTNLTSAAGGAMEYDGAHIYATGETTAGRALNCIENVFLTTADGSALGPSIADAFGSNSAIPTAANAVYEINFYVWYLKSTAGTVTWTVVNTQTFTAFCAYKFQSVAGGLAANGSPVGVGLTNVTAASQAFPATASLTTATNQYTHIRVLCTTANAGDIRLRVTSSAGTVTLRRGSYFTVRRLPAASVGTFAA